MKKLVMIVALVLFFFSISVLLEYISPQNTNFYKQELSLSGEGPLILNYHRVRSSNIFVKTLDKLTNVYTKDAELLLYTVYEDEFKEQLRYLIEKGYYFLTVDEINKYVHNEISVPEKSVLITFDDVDVSVYENAFPFLLEEKIPFTLFIITGEVGNPDFKGLEMASWDQVKEMYDSGLATVGVHTHQMHKLDKRSNPPFFYPNKVDDFTEDTRLTISTVEQKLGITPIYYAYPYGFGTPETDEVILDLGYKLIFTLSPGIIEQGDPSFFMKRVLVSKSSWPKVVEWVEKR